MSVRRTGSNRPPIHWDKSHCEKRAEARRARRDCSGFGTALWGLEWRWWMDEWTDVGENGRFSASALLSLTSQSSKRSYLLKWKREDKAHRSAFA